MIKTNKIKNEDIGYFLLHIETSISPFMLYLLWVQNEKNKEKLKLLSRIRALDMYCIVADEKCIG